MPLLPPKGPRREIAVTQILGFIILPALVLLGVFIYGYLMQN